MASAPGISSSGFHKTRNKKPGKREKEDSVLLDKIEKNHQEFREIQGVIKTYKELRRRSIKVGKNRVHKIMKNNGITGKIRRKWKVQTTDSNHHFPASPNLLNRDFYTDKPNKVWVSDITYIKTMKGFMYLCTVLDLFSRKIVGWSMSESIDSELCVSALRMAVINRRPDTDLIFHSDRGVQYASDDFRDELKLNKMNQSMSRKGNCWDNAVAESFFSILKNEMEFNVFVDSTEGKKYIFDFIEVFYNRKRTHSYLGYVSPEEFEVQEVA